MPASSFASPAWHGSIPAWAGKPASKRLGSTRRSGTCSSGLSPRGRGNRARYAATLSPPGKPRSGPADLRGRGLSPRGRGNPRADPIRSRQAQAHSGLSPRGRGNRPWVARDEALPTRSIPAWAGKPGRRSARRRRCRGLSPRGRGNLCVIMTQFARNEYVKDQCALRRLTCHTANQAPYKLGVRERAMARSRSTDRLDLASRGERGVKPPPLLVPQHGALPLATDWSKSGCTAGMVHCLPIECGVVRYHGPPSKEICQNPVDLFESGRSTKDTSGETVQSQRPRLGSRARSYDSIQKSVSAGAHKRHLHDLGVRA